MKPHHFCHPLPPRGHYLAQGQKLQFLGSTLSSFPSQLGPRHAYISMPTRSFSVPGAVLRPCRHHRCPALVVSGWCPKHRRPTRPDCDRPSSTARGYDRRWRKIRLMFLRANPLCASCGRAANEDDHIKAKRAGGEDDDENLQALCKPCHSIKTMRERFGKGLQSIETGVAMWNTPRGGSIYIDGCR